MLNRCPAPVPLALIVGLVAAVPATGQTTGQGAPLGSADRVIEAHVPVDTLVRLVGLRAAGALEDALEAAERMERRARNRRSRAESARDETRARREAESREIERLGRAMEIADELGRKARKSRLDRDRELRERYRDLLETRAEAYEREMVLAEREERHAEALLELVGRERRLSDDLRQWRLLHGEGAVWSDAAERRTETESAILEGLRRYFEAEEREARQRERVAESRRLLAEKLREFIDRRRELFRD